MNKTKKKNKTGKSLNQRLLDKKAKKLVKKGGKLFVCEPHAHHPNACGTKFITKYGWVECPGCGNQYCRWINYQEPEEPFVA